MGGCIFAVVVREMKLKVRREFILVLLIILAAVPLVQGAYADASSQGTIVGWGITRIVPIDGSGYVAVAAGSDYSLALKRDGSILRWGNNQFGQATPPAGSDYVAIATGSAHNLALKQDRSIVGWGYNEYGQATPPAGSDYATMPQEGITGCLETIGSAGEAKSPPSDAGPGVHPVGEF